MLSPLSKSFLAITLAGLIALLGTVSLTTVLFFFDVSQPSSSGFILLGTFVSVSLLLATRLSLFRSLKGASFFLASLVLFVLTVFLSERQLRHQLDHSPDGQTDHLPAISHFTHGYNPIRDPFFKTAKEKAGSDYPLLPVAHDVDYAAAAPKLMYATRTAFAGLCGSIEGAKALNVALALLCFVFSYAVFEWMGISGFFRLLLSAGTSLNPVAIVQMPTFSYDNFCFTFLCIAGLSFWSHSQRKNTLIAWAGVLALLCLAWSKHTGLVAAGILSISFVGYHYWKHRNWYFSRRQIITLAALGFILLLHPYITNIIVFKNPFYPVSFGNKSIIVSDTAPFFAKAGRLGGLFFTVFSESHRNPYHPKLKAPWIIKKQEAEAFFGPDARIGAFGPWFAFMLLISMGAYFGFSRHKNTPTETVFLILTFLFMALIWPVTYWLRFSPQLWLVPFLLLTSLLSLKNKYARATVFVFFAVTVYNIFFVASSSLKNQVRLTQKYNSQLEAIRELSKTKGPPRVYFSNFHVGRLRLSEKGIPYQAIKENCGSHQIVLVYAENFVCADS